MNFLRHFSSIVQLVLIALFVLFLELSFFQSSVFASSKDIEKAFGRSTPIEEIVKWQDLPGGQYVLGYGIDCETDELVPFAVYDKTFVRPLFATFWRRLLLGTMGIGDLSLAALDVKFQESQIKKRKRLAVDYLLGTSLESSTDVAKDEEEEEEGVYFANDFWQKEDIKWKKGHRPVESDATPPRIALSDLDLDLHKSQKKSKFHSILKMFWSLLGAKDIYAGSSPSENLLADAEFVLQNDGRYRLFVKELNVHPPVKVIDLKGKYSSYSKAIGWATLTNVSKGLVGLVPIPVLSSICSAILERLFNLVELVFLTRHAMALNLILEAKEGRVNSPFYNILNNSQLEAAIVYLKRSNTMISEMIRSAFGKKEELAAKYIAKVHKKRDKNLAYLKDKGLTVYPFDHSFYALALKRDENGNFLVFKIFSLIKNKMLRKKPHAVVDFLKPNTERRQRNVLEGALIASNFLYIPIPFFVSIIKIIYKEAMIREVHRRQMTEAGFKGQLNHGRDELISYLMKEGFTLEQAKMFVIQSYEIIEGRAINPLDLSYKEGQSYKNKVEKWISKKDSSYEIWME